MFDLGDVLDIGSYFYKDGSLIATITDLEVSPEPLLLFQCHILCHLYNKLFIHIVCIIVVIFDTDILY